MDRSQKEYYLREQLRAIQEELGMETSSEADELRVSLREKKLPHDVALKVQKEIDRLERDGFHGRTPQAKPRQFVASAMTATSLEQEPPPLLVGERINSQGSRRIKRLLLSDDYDDIMLVARDQVEGGAHVLDVCCALTERTDEDAQMRALVRKLVQSVEAPLMIDSTEAKVVAAALEANPGRGIVNSINLENGRARIDAIMPLVKEHGAAVIAVAEALIVREDLTGEEIEQLIRQVNDEDKGRE